MLNEMAPDWHKFGLFLGVSDTDLAKIYQSKNVADCMDKMLLMWIKFKGEEATMEAILCFRQPTHQQQGPDQALEGKQEDTENVWVV